MSDCVLHCLTINFPLQIFWYDFRNIFALTFLHCWIAKDSAYRVLVSDLIFDFTNFQKIIFFNNSILRKKDQI